MSSRDLVKIQCKELDCSCRNPKRFTWSIHLLRAMPLIQTLLNFILLIHIVSISCCPFFSIFMEQKTSLLNLTLYWYVDQKQPRVVWSGYFKELKFSLIHTWLLELMIWVFRCKKWVYIVIIINLLLEVKLQQVLMKELREYYLYGKSQSQVISTLYLVEIKPSILRDISWIYYIKDLRVSVLTF